MEEQKILVGKISEVQEGRIKPFAVMGRRGLLVKTGDGIRAFWNCCTHQGGPLRMMDGRLKCLRHGAEFNMETGEALTAPAPQGSKLSEWQIIIEGENIFILHHYES